MATLKWFGGKNWQTLYLEAFEKIKIEIREIIRSINNMAAALRMRARRDKNLGDLYDAADARTNLKLINDCSALSRAPHHHDSRYIPKINAEIARAKAKEEELWAAARALIPCKCTGIKEGGGSPEPLPPPPSEGNVITFSDNGVHGRHCLHDEGAHGFPAPNSHGEPMVIHFNSDWEGQARFTLNLSGDSSRYPYKSTVPQPTHGLFKFWVNQSPGDSNAPGNHDLEVSEIPRQGTGFYTGNSSWSKNGWTFTDNIHRGDNYIFMWAGVWRYCYAFITHIDGTIVKI